ncbi:MAG: hypothetical protein IPO64_13305 [Bacteroidetes bacterium]|jgi:hypothetical protein|nr:hypothetical protein [Bacteroidota bacterium]
MNVIESEKPFYKKKGVLLVGGIIILSLIGKMCGDDTTTNSKIETVENVKPKNLKEITSYTENPYTKAGYENIKTYYYGLYLQVPKDTSGISSEIMGFLKEKSKNAEDNEAVHLWIFSDSTVVPKSFSDEWSNPKNRKKCFAHAVKLANGNYSYDFDIFGEYKPEE